MTMDPVKRKLTQARTNLILEQPFFGTLALQLKLVEDLTCETAWTDGTHLGYNPDYIDSKTLHETIGLVCHEVMHNAAGHPWRKGAREHYRFNVACDYAIDQTIIDAGMQVPDAMLNPAFTNKSAEWIYSQLPPGTGGGGGLQGQGSGQPGRGGAKGQQPGRGCGEVREAPAGGQTQEEWNVLVIQAVNAARSQGKLPGSLSYLIDQLEEPKVDWKAALRRFVQDTAKADYSWRQPNRRYLSLGLFLPQLHSDQMPPVVVAIDTSGSISNEELRAFISETQSIVDECQPETTYMIQCDAAIPEEGGVMEIERGDILKDVRIHGRGGTDFRPVFDYVKENSLQPACLIYLTDLMGSFPEEEPDYPTLWISTNDGAAAPIGETLYMLDGGVTE